VKKRRVETSEDLVRAFADLFDAAAPEMPDEIEKELREAGYDPAEVGDRMQAAAEQALARSPLNWRSRAQAELDDARDRITNFTGQALSDRDEIISAIKQLASLLGDDMSYAYRNLEAETDEDLASLLAELEFLASQQRGQGDE
jgi:phage gp29-like protein